MTNCWTWPYLTGVVLLVSLLLLLCWRLHRTLLDRQERRLQRRMDDYLDHLARSAGASIDTMVQSVHGLILKVQGVATRMPAEESLRLMLDEAMTQAEALLAEGSERGRKLRSRGDPRDLTDMLTAFGRQLHGATGPPCEVTILGQPRILAPGVGTDLFAIGREAMLNAFQHASASHIGVEVAYQRHALCITVYDDGCGLTQGAAHTGKRSVIRGLAGMRDGASKCGAQLRLRTPTGGGTEWVLTLPASIAYAPAWEK